MMRESIYQPFEIVFKDLDVCPKGGHEHNFFELVYIMSGTGTQIINKQQFTYGPGHMFLITPEDCHSFEVATHTQFFFLKFNDIYIKKNPVLQENVQRLEFILQNASHLPGCILKNQIDKTLVKPMVEAINREYIGKDLYNKELIAQLVNTLIIIVARNIAKFLPEQVNESTAEKAMDILQYIQEHIYEPEKISATAISGHFGISDSYLGRYFKRHTNETMQQYITRYKLRLIETRLLHSDLRMNEIATELGFTDESHLNRTFKKYKGMSPSAFRKQQTAVA
jgi:AraC-like DNA-binding protein